MNMKIKKKKRKKRNKKLKKRKEKKSEDYWIICLCNGENLTVERRSWIMLVTIKL